MQSNIFYLLTDSFEERLRKSISFAWQVFMEKAGSGLLEINKEASMQLQYAYILKQIVPLICFNKNESVKIELETGVQIDGRNKEIDLLLIGEIAENSSNKSEYKIAVEMKCYRTLASSGKKRGATTVFMKNVYEDLSLLEKYCAISASNRGVALVMTDMERFAFPKSKEGSCWDYDISHGTQRSNIHLTTPIGVNEFDIQLDKSYEFKWVQKGHFWFMENEGLAP